MSSNESPQEILSVDSVGLSPAALSSCVKVAPPGDWVVKREVDESYLSSAKGGDTIFLLDHQHHADRGECHHRVVRRLETMQAVHEAAQWKLDFDPATQRVVVHSLTVKRPGSEVDHARGAEFRFLHHDDRLESLVLNGWVMVVLLMQDVRVGDILDASYTIQNTPRFLPGRFWLLDSVPLHSALQTYRVSVRFKTGRKMNWGSNDPSFSPEIREENGGTVWNWSVKNPPLPSMEPNVPAWHVMTPRLQVTDCESWGEVSQSLLALWKEDFRDPALVQAAKEISAACNTPAERAERAFRLVQDDIRHVEMNIAPCEQLPAAPGTVLRRRFGDCKDKSSLLLHLLRMLGISARPVLVNTALGKTIEQMLPAPDVFNHVLVEFAIANERRWVDASLAQQGGGPLGRSLHNFGWGLPLAPGVSGLEPLSPPPDANERYELREIFLIDTAGRPSRLEIDLAVSGWHADQLRRGFAAEGEEAVAGRRTEFYRKMFPEIRRIAPLFWQDDREKNEIVLAELYNLPGAVTPNFDEKTCVFQHNAHLIHSILGFPALEKRDHPLELPHPCKAKHWIEVESTALPFGTEPTFARPNQTFIYARESKLLFYRWILHYELETLTGTVTPEQYRLHRQNILAVWPSTQLQIIIPTGVPATRGRPRSENLHLYAAKAGVPDHAAESGGSFAAGRSQFRIPTIAEVDTGQRAVYLEQIKREKFLKLMQFFVIGVTILVLTILLVGAYLYQRSHAKQRIKPKVNWEEIEKLKRRNKTPLQAPLTPAEKDLEYQSSVVLPLPTASLEEAHVTLPVVPAINIDNQPSPDPSASPSGIVPPHPDALSQPLPTASPEQPRFKLPLRPDNIEGQPAP